MINTFQIILKSHKVEKYNDMQYCYIYQWRS